MWLVLSTNINTTAKNEKQNPNPALKATIMPFEHWKLIPMTGYFDSITLYLSWYIVQYAFHLVPEQGRLISYIIDLL